MVESVRAQTFADWELIVVDDGSTDDSAEVARTAAQGDGRVQVLSIPNGGVAHARNRGAEAASPESRFLLFLDADDVLEPAMLERLSAYMESRPEVGMAYSRITFIDEDGRRAEGTPGFHPRYVPRRLGVRELGEDEADTPFCSILALAGIIPSMALIARHVYERAGGWDESFGQGFEDTDLFLRLSLEAPVHLVPEQLVRHRRHATQSSISPGRHDAQSSKLEARWRDVSALPVDQAEIVRAAWRFVDRQLAWAAVPEGFATQMHSHGLVQAARILAGTARITLRSLLHERSR